METEEFETELSNQRGNNDLVESELTDDDLLDEFDVDSAGISEQVESELEQTSRKPVMAMSALPITGEPRVDDALGRLNDLTSLPVHEHVAVFEDVQRRLHETLADLSGQ